MRKTLLLTLVLCVIAVVAYAQAPAAGTASTPAATASTGAASTDTAATTGTDAKAKPAKHKKAAAAKHYKGEVASVDATAKSFVVHPAKGADVTLKVNDKTTYSPKGKGWDDVKAGAAVSGGYKNDGTDNWATSVKFAAEKAAAPAKTGK